MIDFLERREITLKIEAEEFILKEMPMDKFLKAIKALFQEHNTVKFLVLLDIPIDIKVKLIENQEEFDKFVDELIKLHTDENIIKTGVGEENENWLESFFDFCSALLSALWKNNHGNPKGLSRLFTLRQITFWMDKMYPPVDKNKNTSKLTEEGRFKPAPVPANARNYKEWTDGAGNQCRSWEIEC